MEKKWFESRTIWFNLFMGVAGVVVALVPKSAPVLTETSFALIWTFASIWLRKETVKAIK